MPTLRREGYYVVPSIDELRQMSAMELQAVRNLRVGRTDYGEVRDHAPTPRELCS